MNSSRKNIIGLLPRWLVSGAIALVVLALPGCDTEKVEWEEDRGIPFSSDDRAIAYRHKGALYVARAQGDNHRRVFVAETGEAVLSTPHWGPGMRAIVFAVSDGKPEQSSGLLEYELWLWPAPQEIWTSERGFSRGDSVALPSDWRPATPRKLAVARCKAPMQIKADALVQWHPDGNRLLYLDTGESGLQRIVSLDVNTATQTAATTLMATSLAFSISPAGNHLAVATEGPEPAALWVGPIGGDKASWRRIEGTPGPRLVPELETEGEAMEAGSKNLFDLRPRLGVWSPDSRWLAHISASSAEQEMAAEGETDEAVRLVFTPLEAGASERALELAGGEPENMHWMPGGRKLGFLGDQKVLLVDSDSATVTELSGVLEVEHFIGWSAPGNHMAYLIRAEDFERTGVLLPTGDRVLWSAARRHNLMVAQANGSFPRNRFGLMNISSAQWGNRTEQLSFWATHLPTVSFLPPGDPAAVLDLEQDSIRWYPTDVAEYAQVGHYYFLNGQFVEAADHYTSALERLDDPGENRVLEARVRLWRALSRIAAQDEREVLTDLVFFREHIVVTEEADTDMHTGPDGPVWDETVSRNLTADRILLSTLLSMKQVKLAAAQAQAIIRQDEDARRIQALCFLALIDKGIAQRTMFTDVVIGRLMQELLESVQVPAELVDELFDEYLEAILDPESQRALSVRNKKRFGGMLANLAVESSGEHLQKALRLMQAAIIFYREAGETSRELELLQAAAEMRE